MTWDEAAAWAAAKACGMLVEAQVALADCPEVQRPWVDFRRPDEYAGGGMTLSTEWWMEYRSEDLPGLHENDEVDIGGVLYRVRESPRVPERGTGYSRIAILTRLD